MQKNIMLSVFLCIASQAQITYQSTDFAAIGTSVSLGNSQNLVAFNFAQAGANVIWDFSSIQSTGNSISEFVNPTSQGNYRTI